jgi:hypothetical protein
MRPSSNFPGSNPFSEWTIGADDADARIARAIRRSTAYEFFTGDCGSMSEQCQVGYVDPIDG